MGGRQIEECQGMTPGLLFHELTREEAGRLAPEAVIVVPVGATEQHGPHLPVGTDTLAVEAFARSAASAVAGRLPIVVTPTLPFGCSPHHLPFGGTMSLSTETYFRVVFELVESLIVGGWRRILIVNGHGGNHELIQLAARDLALKHPASIAALSYWMVAWDALIDLEAHLGGRLPGHAGAFESSLVLALRPDLVREPRPHREGDFATNPRGFSPPFRLEIHDSWHLIDGFSDSPDRGSVERGERYVRTVGDALARALVQFYVATGGTPREAHRD